MAIKKVYLDEDTGEAFALKDSNTFYNQEVEYQIQAYDTQAKKWKKPVHLMALNAEKAIKKYQRLYAK